MSNERVWNDKSRDDLRKRLQSAILGELRLAKRSHEDILETIVETCSEAYFPDECPECELEAFFQFTAEELDRAAIRLASKKATWPEETDCDRLDRVEAALRDQGILMWQASPCCDTCTWSELPDRIDEINGRYPGFRDRVRGYTFFIDQNMPEMLAESSHLLVYLSYGCFSPDDSRIAPAVYKENALGIAREVCKCLHDEGFEVDWDGDFARQICITLNWRRRTMLE